MLSGSWDWRRLWTPLAGMPAVPACELKPPRLLALLYFSRRLRVSEMSAVWFSRAETYWLSRSPAWHITWEEQQV